MNVKLPNDSMASQVCLAYSYKDVKKTLDIRVRAFPIDHPLIIEITGVAKPM